MATKLSQNQLSQNLDLSAKTVLLPVATDSVVHYADRSDFPTTGRLKRLYVAQNTGVLWAWTGTTYQQTSPTVSDHTSLTGDVRIAETAIAAETTARQTAISGVQASITSLSGNLSSAIGQNASDIFDLQQADTTLSSRIGANETAISTTLPALIDDAESFEQLPTFADFPTTGRLHRLYLDKSNGTLWRWTGTTYSPVPGEQDGGTY